MINFAVLHKELRQKLQGWDAFVGFCAYIMIAAFITFTITLNSESVLFCNVGNMIITALFGFQVYTIMMLLIILSSISLSQEIGKQTYEILLSTPVSRVNIIIEKVLAYWFFFAVIIISVLAPSAVCILFGGVTLSNIVGSYYILLIEALFCASLGIYLSAVLKKTYLALIASVVIIFIFLIVTVFFSIFSDYAAAIHPLYAGLALFDNAEILCFGKPISYLLLFTIIQLLLIALLINESIRLINLEDSRIFTIIKTTLFSLLWVVLLIYFLGVNDSEMKSGRYMFGNVTENYFLFFYIAALAVLPTITGARKRMARLPGISNWLLFAFVLAVSVAIYLAYYFHIKPEIPSLNVVVALLGLILLGCFTAGLCGTFGALCFKNNIASRVTAYVLLFIFLSCIPVANAINDNLISSAKSKDGETITTIASAVHNCLPTSRYKKSNNSEPIDSINHLYIYWGSVCGGMVFLNIIVFSMIRRRESEE